MRVGLIDTLDKTSSGKSPNLSIAYLLGSLVEQGHDVGVCDLFFSDKAAQEQFLGDNWDLIGITSTSYAFPVCRDVIKAVKQINPGVPIVVGGAHASVAKDKILDEKEIDFAVYGEGEITLCELAKTLEMNPEQRPAALKTIDGLIFRDQGVPTVNAPRQRIRDIDSLPLPPYHLFPMEKYDSYNLATSRGCPYSCVYCASKAILGRKWVARDPHRVAQEVAYLIANFGRRHFNLIDDCFNLKEDRIKTLCRLLIDKKMNIQWSACGIRADKTDLEMLRLMKASGCNSVCVGIESANPNVLKAIGKGETIQQISEGIRRLQHVGLETCGMFMIGNPGDTISTVNESIEFAKTHDLKQIMFYHAIPFPGTDLWTFSREQGRVLRRDYHNFHDYLEEPVFETDAFTGGQRVQAYQAAREVMFPEEQHRSPLTRQIWRVATLLKQSVRFLRSARENNIAWAMQRIGNKIRSRTRSRGKKDDSLIKTRFSRQ